MGKLDEFRIEFSANPPVFHAGQPVTGVVVVVLNDALKMRAIKMECEGKAKVQWKDSHMEQDGDESKTVIDEYEKKKEYFEFKTALFGDPKANAILGDNPTLSAGTHSFPFSFDLPPHIPCSYDGSPFGKISYKCKAVIDKPWKKDHEVKAKFTVVTPYDLTKDSKALKPSTDKDHKYHCCLCCRSGPITAVINIAETCGFVAGETIPVGGEISNLSTVKINEWKVELWRKVKFLAHGYEGEQERTLEQVLDSEGSHEEIAAGEEFPISCQLRLPPGPPTGLPFCDFIDVKYKVRLLVKPKRSMDLDVSTHIIVGNIPIKKRSTPPTSQVYSPELAAPSPPGTVPESDIPAAPVISGDVIEYDEA